MELALRFLLFLRKLITFFHKRWDQSTRRLWYIFALIRSRVFPKSPKKRDEICRNVEPRLAKPPTTVICASGFPPRPPLTPIAGGDTPIASPAPTSIQFQIRRPTVLDPEDTVNEAYENPSGEHLGVDGYFLQGSRPILRSLESPTYHHEPESIHVAPPLHQEGHGSHPPVIPSRPISQYSARSASQISVYRPQSEYSIHPPSVHSNRSHLNGAEVAARGYLHAPPPQGRSSPTHSIAGSVSSRVYRASRPKTRVQRPTPMRNTSKRRDRSSTPASTRQSVHAPPPMPTRPASRASGHRDRPSTTVSFAPASSDPPSSDPPIDSLRPMVGVNRYEKKVVIEDIIHSHVSPPVTTEFVR